MGWVLAPLPSDDGLLGYVKSAEFGEPEAGFGSPRRLVEFGQHALVGSDRLSGIRHLGEDPAGIHQQVSTHQLVTGSARTFEVRASRFRELARLFERSTVEAVRHCPKPRRRAVSDELGEVGNREVGLSLKQEDLAENEARLFGSSGPAVRRDQTREIVCREREVSRLGGDARGLQFALREGLAAFSVGDREPDADDDDGEYHNPNRQLALVCLIPRDDALEALAVVAFSLCIRLLLGHCLHITLAWWYRSSRGRGAAPVPEVACPWGDSNTRPTV